MKLTRGEEMSCRPLVSVLMALIAVFPPETLAQTGDWQKVRTLPRGADIVLTTKAGARYQSKVVDITEDAISVDSDERAFPGRVRRRRNVPRAEVLELRAYRPGASMFAVIGIGTAVGAGIGVAVDGGGRSNEDGRLATVLFTLLGAMLGWAIGRHSTLIKGERIYVAP